MENTSAVQFGYISSAAKASLRLQEDFHPQLQKFAGIIGSSTALLNVLERIRIVAPSNATVLITGESGTGKELIARAIHQGVAAIAIALRRDE